MLRGVVDRIEGEVVVVVLSDGNQLMVKRHHLPDPVREGNVLDLNFTVNVEAEEEQRRKVEDLQQMLADKGPGRKDPDEG